MLNAAQTRAVESDGHSLISAGPGSGKTSVQSHRAARLLEADRESRLIAVTFTNDAAEELKQRILKRAPSARSRVIVGTFHKLAKLQLEDSSGRRVNLVKDGQQQDFVRRAYEEVLAGSEEHSREDCEQYLNYRKSRLDIGDMVHEDLEAFYECYQELLAKQGAMDFGDLVVEAVRGMQSGQIKPLKARYLLVDEFQDADEAQLAWLLLHAEAGAQVTVVGDDDQSVFGFRHALGHSALVRFQRATGAEHITLDITYRCARSILEHASRLIQHNVDRVPKALKTANPEVGEVVLKPCANRLHEAQLIADTILASSSGEWAVLARSNAMLNRVEARLRIASIRYERPGAVSIWDSSLAELYVGVLTSLVQGTLLGVGSLLGACNVSRSLQDALHEALRSGEPGALARFADIEGVAIEGPAGRSSLVVDLRKASRQWLTLLRHGSVNPVLLGVADWIDEKVGRKGKSKVAIGDCADAMVQMKGTLPQRLRALNEPRESEGKVMLMTLHGSKGLEFTNVWVLGCEEGNLPHSGGDDAEERRLMYVGMTRAKSRLYLSHIIDPDAPPSKFLTEAGVVIAAAPEHSARVPPAAADRSAVASEGLTDEEILPFEEVL